MQKKIWMLSSLLLAVVLLAIFATVYHRSQSSSPLPQASPTPTPTPTTSSSPSATAPSPTPTSTPAAVVAPTDQFKERITKKFFGTYVTPINSPVSPEKFTGYHTGVDVEFTDTSTDIAVHAIANGKVVTSKYATGYGGVMVIQHQVQGRTLYAIYGHLRQSTMVKTGTLVTQGQQIAVLGTGYSSETNGERHHLHFGIATSNTILGYATSESQLHATWIDPLSLY